MAKSEIRRLLLILLLLATVNVQLSTLLAQPTAFTYQGRFTDGDLPANGLFDMRFRLFNSSTNVAGSTVGSALTNLAVPVIDGLFAVTLDFGADAFSGTERWLEIGVRPNGGDSFVSLAPRQAMTSTPYAITSRTLTGVVPSSGLSGTYGGIVNFSAAGNRFTGEGSGLVSLNASQLTSGTVPAAALDNAWKATGNAGTTPGTHFIGTTDHQPLEFKVNGLRTLRFVDNGDGGDADAITDGAPNVIGGSPVNFVAPGVVGATIAGGGTTNYAGLVHSNAVLADYGAIGGGRGHRIEGNARNSTIGGGLLNNISNSVYATIAGGQSNDIEAHNSAIGGGNGNKIGNNSDGSTIAGGVNNAIGEGSASSVIGGGTQNEIDNSARSTLSGGHRNVITNSDWAVIPGGYQNEIHAADYAFAAGRRAHANHPGAFVWADSEDADFASLRNNHFRVRANGGARFDVGGDQWVEIIRRGSILNPPLKLIDTSTGAYLSQGGAWVDASDRDRKENFKPVEATNILGKVAALSITTWNYKSESASIQHIGPTAQDFHAAFGAGADDKHIAALDANGVALAAIQGLNQKLEEREESLRHELKRQAAENAELKRQLRELKQLIRALTHQLP